jgi:hypothetical protein
LLVKEKWKRTSENYIKSQAGCYNGAVGRRSSFQAQDPRGISKTIPSAVRRRIAPALRAVGHIYSHVFRKEKTMRSFRRLVILGLTAGAMAGLAVPAWATPYASNVTKVGTAVSFTLNEPTDTLKYSVNGGALVSLDGTAKGTKTFNLGSPTDTFSIVADKNSSSGYTIPTGATVPTTDSGSLNAATPASGLNLISNDADKFSWYGAPRGVGVSTNPNSPNFGTAYISNGNTTATLDPPNGPGARTMNDGLFAVHADQTDAYGFGDNGQNPNAQDGFPSFSTASSNSPYRVTVASDGTVYVADFADVNSNVFAVDPNLGASKILLTGITGTTGTANPDGTSLAVGMNHGSVVSAAVTGSLATNDLVLYTLDEDLTSAHVTGNLSDNTADKYSVWKYNIGGGPLTVSTMPTKVVDHLSASAGNTFADMDRGADGKFYLSVNPSTANPAPTRLIVTDPSGTKLFDSLTASQALGNATDIIANLNEIAISPDQKWLAGMLNFSDVLVVPLINGIPDLANRLVVDAGNVNSGRDITFDAADNIHLVSSGQALYRVLSPGGHTITTLTWNGSTYSFNLQTVAAGIPGDFNNDGKVDSADYVTWRKGAATPSDYALWRSHFGLPSGSGAGIGATTAVPEPMTATMLLIAGLLTTCIRRRRSAP